MLYLPDQSSILNVILSSEVNDHWRPELVDALENTQVEIHIYFLQHPHKNKVRSLLYLYLTSYHLWRVGSAGNRLNSSVDAHDLLS